MVRFSSSVILIMAFSKAFELGLVVGLGHELTHPPQKDLSFRNDSIQSQEAPAVRPPSLQFVPSMEIQHSKEQNRTCCLNGGTCMLGSFCACPHFFYGRNCEYDVRKESCDSVPHDTWLPRKCSMCKCWRGQFRCFPQTFLPGCGGHVVDEHPEASRTPEIPLSARIIFMLASICFSIQSYY
ncbi:teratocarcinoma-derived growth factor 1 [Nycticebus coucang]|uniref:teratocarcinoma-derived growth factor 1 n=1 Tax=Nycticebus coucang TaxID=9470 RepID=UPI00234D82FE|nr:teratocarcinoma-derived growth factor 1 [Nycticebus coucang]XP_053455881.1 teratocarcinoma-derived growth factor 1 [Nycticebus coucang]